jgi:hypothetical protein
MPPARPPRSTASSRSAGRRAHGRAADLPVPTALDGYLGRVQDLPTFKDACRSPAARCGQRRRRARPAPERIKGSGARPPSVTHPAPAPAPASTAEQGSRAGPRSRSRPTPTRRRPADAPPAHKTLQRRCQLPRAIASRAAGTPARGRSAGAGTVGMTRGARAWARNSEGRSLRTVRRRDPRTDFRDRSPVQTATSPAAARPGRATRPGDRRFEVRSTTQTSTDSLTPPKAPAGPAAAAGRRTGTPQIPWPAAGPATAPGRPADRLLRPPPLRSRTLPRLDFGRQRVSRATARRGAAARRVRTGASRPPPGGPGLRHAPSPRGRGRQGASGPRASCDSGFVVRHHDWGVCGRFPPGRPSPRPGPPAVGRLPALRCRLD